MTTVAVDIVHKCKSYYLAQCVAEQGARRAWQEVRLQLRGILAVPLSPGSASLSTRLREPYGLQLVSALVAHGLASHESTIRVSSKYVRVGLCIA